MTYGPSLSGPYTGLVLLPLREASLKLTGRDGYLRSGSIFCKNKNTIRQRMK